MPPALTGFTIVVLKLVVLGKMICNGAKNNKNVSYVDVHAGVLR